MRPQSFIVNGQAGVSLLGTLVAVSICGIIAAGMAGMFSNATSMSSYLEKRQDIQELKRAMARTSCEKTLPAGAACVDGQFYALRRSDNSLIGIAAANESGVYKLGKAMFRARCAAASLNVETPELNPTGYAKDPAGRLKGWKSIYGAGSDQALCASKTPNGWKPIRGGQCVFKEQIRNHPNPASGPFTGDWRSQNVQCPSSHPTAFSVTTRPSCDSQGWQQQMLVSPDGTPNGGMCSNYYFEDLHPSVSSRFTVSQYQGMQNACYNPVKGNAGNFGCQVICCE